MGFQTFVKQREGYVEMTGDSQDTIFAPQYYHSGDLRIHSVCLINFLSIYI
jgi:hypothetical protein